MRRRTLRDERSFVGDFGGVDERQGTEGRETVAAICSGLSGILSLRRYVDCRKNMALYDFAYVVYDRVSFVD